MHTLDHDRPPHSRGGRKRRSKAWLLWTMVLMNLTAVTIVILLATVWQVDVVAQNLGAILTAIAPVLVALDYLAIALMRQR